VTDFISVGTFPVFNIADSSITVGVIALLLGVWWQERAERAKKAKMLAASSEQPSEATSE
jgi:signal peptidase II